MTVWDEGSLRDIEITVQDGAGYCRAVCTEDEMRSDREFLTRVDAGQSQTGRPTGSTAASNEVGPACPKCGGTSPETRAIECYICGSLS